MKRGIHGLCPYREERVTRIDLWKPRTARQGRSGSTDSGSCFRHFIPCYVKRRTVDAYENSRKCCELKLYFSQSAGKKKK